MDSVQAAIIVRNEEANLAACLESLTGIVDDVVVLDTGSTDATVQIARAFTENVHTSTVYDCNTDAQDFHFGNARNEALSHCRRGWVLSVDADEIVSGDGLRSYFDDHAHSSYEVGIRLTGDYTGTWGFQRRGTLMAFVPRLFRNDGLTKWRYRVHEIPEPFAANRLPIGVALLDHQRSSMRQGTLDRNHGLLKQQLRETWSPEWSNSDRLKTLIDIGGVSFNRHEYFEAIGYLTAALHFVADKGRRAGMLHHQLAACFYRVGLIDKTVQHAMDSWRIAPGFLESLLLLIAALLAIKRFAEALPLIRAARCVRNPDRIVEGDDDERFERNWLDAAESRCLAA